MPDAMPLIPALILSALATAAYYGLKIRANR